MKRLRLIVLGTLLQGALQAQPANEVNGYRLETWKLLQQKSESYHYKQYKSPAVATTLYGSQPQVDIVLLKPEREILPMLDSLLRQNPSLAQVTSIFPQLGLDTIHAALYTLKRGYTVESRLFALKQRFMPPESFDLPNGWPKVPLLAGTWSHKYYPEYSSLYAKYVLEDLVSKPLPMPYQLRFAGIESAIGGLRSVHLPDAYSGHPEFDLGDLASMSLSKKKSLLQEHRSKIVTSSCMDGGPRSHLEQIGLLAAEVGDFPLWLLVQFQLLSPYFDPDMDGPEDYTEPKQRLKALYDLGLPMEEWLITLCLKTDDNGIYRPELSPYKMTNLIQDLPATEVKRFQDSMLSVVSDKTLDYYNRQQFYRAYESAWVMDWETVKDSVERKRLDAAGADLGLR